MEGHNQKERLEQELRFLKESYEAEVISREEFEKGKERIEKKLKELESPHQSPDHENNQEAEAEQSDKKEEKLPNEKASAGTESGNAEKKPDIDDKKNIVAESIEEKAEESSHPKENKAFKFAVVFVVLVLAAFFSYSLFGDSKNQSSSNSDGGKLMAACDSNDDCIKDKLQGTCISLGTKDAKCEYLFTKRTKVLVLNDKEECFNCDTTRVLGILQEWFGELELQEIDINTNDGKNLAASIDARMLPSYVIYENISSDSRFEKFRRAFVSKNDAYVLSEDAAASTFYFQREDLLNKLDLFVKEGDSATTKAENNIKEFLENFPDVDFDAHYPDDSLTKELGIKTFPTFLINNRVKFLGIHAADTIKDNFCTLNMMDECNKELSRNII